MSISRLWIPGTLNGFPTAVLDQRELASNPLNTSPLKQFLEVSPLYYIRNISQKYFMRSLIHGSFAYGRFSDLINARINYEMDRQTIIFQDGDSDETMPISLMKKITTSNLYGTMFNRQVVNDEVKKLRNMVMMENLLYMRTFMRLPM